MGLTHFLKQVCVSALLLSSFPAAAQTDWKAAMAGVDGVIVYCELTTREGYAADICGGIAGAVEQSFEGSGLVLVNTGTVHTGSAAKDGDDPAALKTAEGMERPLLLRILIKGTSNKNPAVYAGLRVAMPYSAAVEQGSDAPGVAGELVLAEVDVVADGTRKQLIAGITQYIAGKAKPMIEAMRAGI